MPVLPEQVILVILVISIVHNHFCSNRFILQHSFNTFLTGTEIRVTAISKIGNKINLQALGQWEFRFDAGKTLLQCSTENFLTISNKLYLFNNKTGNQCYAKLRRKELNFLYYKKNSNREAFFWGSARSRERSRSILSVVKCHFYLALKCVFSCNDSLLNSRTQPRRDHSSLLQRRRLMLNKTQ